MKKFTVMEMLVILAIVGILFGMIFLGGESNTREKVRENAELWINENNVQDIKRFSVSGDSDGDGWGTVTIVLEDGEKIFLQCRSLRGNVCKEVDTLQKLNQNIY